MIEGIILLKVEQIILIVILFLYLFSYINYIFSLKKLFYSLKEKNIEVLNQIFKDNIVIFSCLKLPLKHYSRIKAYGFAFSNIEYSDFEIQFIKNKLRKSIIIYWLMFFVVLLILIFYSGDLTSTHSFMENNFIIKIVSERFQDIKYILDIWSQLLSTNKLLLRR